MRAQYTLSAQRGKRIEQLAVDEVGRRGFFGATLCTFDAFCDGGIVVDGVGGGRRERRGRWLRRGRRRGSRVRRRGELLDVAWPGDERGERATGAAAAASDGDGAEAARRSIADAAARRATRRRAATLARPRRIDDGAGRRAAGHRVARAARPRPAAARSRA